MDTTWLAIQPLDVLMLRGNRLFGGGVHGVSSMPPRPSVVTGAVVSRALAEKNRVGEVTRSPDRATAVMHEVLGGDFTLTLLGLLKDGVPFFPLPADLAVFRSDGGKGKGYEILPLKPVKKPKAVGISTPLPCLPVLRSAARRKTLQGKWCSLKALKAHLEGRIPKTKKPREAAWLWANDPRLGIALHAGSRTVEEGALYTTDAVALKPGVSLLAGFRGKDIPKSGLIRLGGDGRGAVLSAVTAKVAASLDDLGRPDAGWRGFRMILATPGMFPGGWRPPGLDEKNILTWNGLKAELVAAVVPRSGVISGWDLARHAPKPAFRIAPAGSCYWFRVLEGDCCALEELRQEGLWRLLGDAPVFRGRRHEGWNRVWFGCWDGDDCVDAS